VWKIPPLQPRSPGDETTPAVVGHQPLHRSPLEVLDRTVVFTASPVWYATISPETSSFVHFDILHDLDGGGSLTRYVARYNPDGGPSYLPVQVEMSTLEKMNATSAETAVSLRTGSNEFYVLWWKGTSLFMQLSKLSSNSVSVSQTSAVQLAVPYIDGHQYGQIVCCPLSGRICILYGDVEVDGAYRAICVMDFLKSSDDWICL
jgi:hypothetical protein